MVRHSEFRDRTVQEYLHLLPPGGALRSEMVQASEARIPGESAFPGETKEVLQFSNETLKNIDLLRHPPSLPGLQAGQEGPPAGKEEKTFYHGSTQEEELVQALKKAKTLKDKKKVLQARENLHRYWRQIIDEEYRSTGNGQIAGRVEEIRKRYKQEPDNPFLNYRLHSLAVKAGELNDTSSLEKIDNIRHGSLNGSSVTGLALSKYAEDNATGTGGECYRYVADALDQIGVYLTGESAYMAADQLAGNRKMREVKGVTKEQLSTLPAGAIVVWNCSSDHPDGHISISLGNGKEASDLIRYQITDYGTDYRLFVPADM